MAGLPILTGSKLLRRPRNIKPLHYENNYLQWYVRQRLDERCLTQSDSRPGQNG